MKNFFLVTTDHLKEHLWFRDEDDFRVAMNYVAIVAFITGCTVLSFILMSHHVHFVLMCRRKDAETFINKFKRLYAAYYQKKYGVCELLRRNGVDIKEGEHCHYLWIDFSPDNELALRRLDSSHIATGKHVEFDAKTGERK